MKLIMWVVFVLALALPALLVAIALGPVIVGVLCAVGFGVIVATIAYALGLVGRGFEKAGSRFTHR
jgi:hypothetical protein